MSDNNIIQLIMDLYNQGHTCKTIAEAINTNTFYVYKVIQRELKKADLNAIRST